MLPLHDAQLLTYLKLTGNQLGYLLNFNVRRFKDGIKRLVLLAPCFVFLCVLCGALDEA